MASYQIGAALYALWGVLHILVGVLALAASQGGNLSKTLGVMANNGAARNQGVAGDPAVMGLLRNGAFNLAGAGLFVLVVAVMFNWHNDPMWFWANVAVASIIDLGFILFVVIPGHMKLSAGLPGPILWIAGTIFLAIGYQSAGY